LLTREITGGISLFEQDGKRVLGGALWDEWTNKARKCVMFVANKKGVGALFYLSNNLDHFMVDMDDLNKGINKVLLINQGF